MKKIYMMLLVFLLIATGNAFSQTTYFSKAAATDFNDVNSWGTAADGTGTAPAAISNANYFTIANSSLMTLSGNAAVGKLTINSGSLTLTTNNLVVAFPTGNNSTLGIGGGILTVSGGNLVVNGNFSLTSGKFNQSGGIISVDGNNAGAAATSVASGTNIVSIAPALNTDLNLSGGAFIIVDPHYASTSTLKFSIPSAGNTSATGTHTFQFGDGISTDPGSTRGFGFYNWNGTGIFRFKNVIVNGGTGTNRFFDNDVTESSTFAFIAVTGDFTINANSEFRNISTSNTTGASYFAGNIINNGQFTSTNTVFFANVTAASSTSLTVSAATTAQTVSGTGIFKNLLTAPTANFTSVNFNNTSTGGVTLPGTTNIAAQPANSSSISGTLTFTAGKAFSAPAASVVLGIATPAVGTLAYTAGGFGSGTKFGRWFTATTTGSTFTASADQSSATSRYPFVAANLDGRSAWLNRVTPTAGGVMYVTYTEAAAGTTPVSITDGAYNVTSISNDSWGVSGTAAATSYGIAIVAPNVYGVTPPDATSRVVRAADVVGTYLAGTATPGGQRTGINSTDIVSTFYLGINLSVCSGTPNAGSSATSTYNLCTGATQVLTVTGVSTGIGISYQWESSDDGVSGWANVTGGSGATTISYTTPAFTGTIYYRLKTTCSASSLNNISNVITVTTPAVPATQATAFTASGLASTGATLNWVNGSGNNRSVFINTTNSFTDPTSPNTPGTAATTYTTGQQLVYDGTGTSVSVTGLTAGTTYYVRIYESQKCTSPAAWYYNTTTAANNPGNFSTLTPPVNDLVCNAINLTVDDLAPSCVNTTVATTSASDPDISACSTPNNTVWYKFTPTVSGVHTIIASVPAASTGGMSAWLFTYTATGSCPGALTFTAAGSISCTAGPSSAAAGTITTVTTSALIAGTTYYILVDGNTGSFGDICLRVSGPQPMSYVSSNVTQGVTTSVTQGNANTQILGLQVVVTGSLSPLAVTNINFNTNGTTLPADVTQAKVYYTGTSSTFATTTQFGTAYLNPNGIFTVTGSQALTGGGANTTNYFWLVYDVSCNATAADVLDAEVPSFNIGASNYIPTTTAPSGNRAITALYTPTRTDGNSTTAIPVGSLNAKMVYGLISGSATCGANVTKVDFTVSGTNTPVDINQAKCYYTTTSTFSAATPFGSAIANPAAGTVSFTGTQALATGSNYFWMVYDINCSATAANSVNGDINTIYVNSNPIAVTGTATSANNIAAASSTYTTVADGEWNNSSTWTCGAIPPTNATTITIANNITVSNAGNIGGSVTINSGASLTINSGGNLTLGVTGGDSKTLTNNGTLSVTGGTLTQNGNVILSSGSTFNQSGGNFVVDGNGASSVASGTVLFLVNSNLGTVNGGTLTIVDPPATGTARSFAFSTSSAHASWAGHTLRFGDGVSTATSTNTNGFEFDTYVSSGRLLLGNVIADGGSAVNRWVNTSSALGNGSYVGGNLTINAGSEVRTNGAILLVGGNVVNNGTLTTTVTLSLLTLSGSTVLASTIPQSISGSGVFRNSVTTSTANLATLEAWNTSATGVTLNLPLSVSNTFYLDGGKVNTTAANLLTVGISGTTIGTISYTAGMVVGPIKKWYAAATGSSLLPVGDGTNYKPAIINFTTAPTTAGTLTARWSSAAPSFPNAAPLTEGALVVNSVSKNGSWFVEAGDGLAGGAYTATMTGNGSTDVIAFAKTVLVKRPSAGGDWTLEGTHVTSTGSNTAPVLSRTGITTFSEFAIGGEANIALPISLEYFRGSKQTAGNVLDWKVNSSSTSTMTLERSTDKVNYKSINAQTATISQMLAPFSYTDAAPAAGINYYRLKVTNADGESKYSNVVALVNKDKGFELISVVPNPVQHSTVLSLSSAKAGKIDIAVSDVTGKIVKKQSVNVIAGNNPITLNFANLEAGTYQISAINAEGESKTTRFVKF